ncbi:MAG: hypothetical protein ABIQ72_00140 [Usitatibacter sp.]
MNIFRLITLCAVLATAPAFAQKACSKSDAANADKAIERVVNWASLYKAYTDYHHCDTGNTEDSYTDAILRLMVEWKNVDAVAGQTTKDGDYKAWLVKHLQSPAAKDDRESVYSRARKDCPAKQEAFCSDLAEAVKGKGGVLQKVAPAAAPEGVLDLSPMKPFTPSSTK